MAEAGSTSSAQAPAADCFFDLNKGVENGDQNIGVSELTLLISLNEIAFDPDSKEKPETLVQRYLQSNSIGGSTLTREQFRICLQAYCSDPLAPETRTEDRVYKNTKDIAEIQSIYALWAGKRNQCLEHTAMSTVLSLFNKSSDNMHEDPSRRNKAGRMLINYYDRASYGYEINVSSFTMWIWEESQMLLEDFKVETAFLLNRLRQFVRLVGLFNLWDWQKAESLQVEEINKIIAEYNGQDPATVDTSKRPPKGLPYCTETDPLGVKEFSIFLREGILGLDAPDFGAEVSKLEAIVMSRSLLTQVVAAFRKYDVNGDGVISKKELQNVMSRIYDFKSEELDLLMEGADTKKDGLIDYAEFARWVLETVSAEAFK
mmetsp:Transcript_42556/g.76214  ORF Transcript_42556/g.76214 Transcript_42556/m.76214 type:complete len:374 (+) Transcript_42556:204-1325(+)